MGLFRRGKTLNERLLDQAGMSSDGTERAAARVPEQPESALWSPLRFSQVSPDPAASIGGRDWELQTSASLPGLRGDRYELVALPDDSLVVGKDCNEDLSPIADEVEKHIPPPFRAAATRHEQGIWSIGASRIAVAHFEADGDDLDLSRYQGSSTYTVDGADADPSRAPQALVDLGEARGADFTVHATRVEADDWQIDADAL